MTQLDLDQLQGLLYFFAGGTVLVLALLITYIVVAGRRQRASAASLGGGELAQTADLPKAEPVMSLFRTRPGGRLEVEIEGARYQKLSQVEDPEVKRKIVAIATELIHFTGVLDSEPAAPAPVDKTQTWREDVRQGSQAELARARSSTPGEAGLQPSPTPQEVEARFLSLLTEMGHTPAPPERPSLLDSLQHRLQPKPVEPRRPRTFVDDIDDILQRRVQLMPALTGRDLHVQPAPGGKVRFAFEGQYYDSIEDVPNLTARQLIKDAIQEWDETT